MGAMSWIAIVETQTMEFSPIFFSEKKKKNSPMVGWGQMSKSQTAGLESSFTKKLDTIRFTHNNANFDVTYENHQNWLKTYFMNILRIFDDHHMWH